MKRYSFQSKMTISEISSIFKALPPVSLTSMTTSDVFCGDMSNRRIQISRVPPIKVLRSLSFFCGRIKESIDGTYIIGYFSLPLKYVAVQYGIISLLMLFVGGVVGFLVGIMACALLHIMQMLMLSINTQSKRDIILFITTTFDSVLLQHGPL